MHDATWHTITFTHYGDMNQWIKLHGDKVTYETLYINTTPEEFARGILNCGVRYKMLMRVY